ncbi:peptidoglycan/LPS O-acetylase OafA/YrhL [Kitasatospora gansuensis]|uniref:Peptidoglycan/LPS O-acetylase OafA/YrhL n=1 Tax=Kitasatospora gansuensis TaxID=258050 RepID=A0A7W7WI19_9ACTN|nr:peptidoglycan/LPS O-acetylase OafA/YrhL [Kitasatospora gansuensis]
MRIIAALLVFFFHALYQFPFADQGTAGVYNSIFGQGGWTGVGFFFVLSGFVLAWSARAGDTTPKFLRRRFFKIFPNHLVTYLAAVVVFLLAGTALGGWKAVANLVLLQAWFPQIDVETSVNPVSWSLSVEALFYLSFPFLLRLVNRIRPDRLWYWAGAVVAVIFTVPVLAWALPEQPGLFFAPVSEWEFWLVYVLPPVRVLDFTLGILLAKIVQQGRWINLPLLPSMALVVAAYALSSQVSWTYGLVAVMVVPLGLMIAAAANADLTGRWSPLRSRAMVWLGNVSFAFYLWHSLVLTQVHRALGLTSNWSDPGAFGYLALSFAVTLLLAWGLFALVEEPVMRRWSKSRRRPPAVPEAGPEQPVPVGAGQGGRR